MAWGRLNWGGPRTRCVHSLERILQVTWNQVRSFQAQFYPFKESTSHPLLR
ncbi:hypothetical protein GWK47_013296 [Chionoecetes opilio]|uniref:Uncharacterized protein n=1 Tax=Chionoecetes opilio TaxID=41210 RepID=A0A8J4XY11_CHIOP|nr:hypothetical protein GWK47_013296 [Chionoecetes opilio]